MVPLLLIPLGCLETTTDEPKPLPEIYTMSEGSSEEAGLVEGEPFGDWDGEVVVLSLDLESELAKPARIDFLTPDPAALGGWVREGTVQLGEAQDFLYELPADLGTLQVRACHDLAQDGPELEDPADLAVIEVGDEDISVTLELVEGGLLAAIEALDPPFDEGIVLSGVLSGELDRPVVLDLRDADEALIGAWTLPGLGPFSILVPPDLGGVVLSAWIDRNLDGPSSEDHLAELDLTLAGEDIEDLDLLLEEGRLAGSEALPDVPLPFEGYEGERVSLSGEVVGELELSVDLDLRGVDPESGRLGNLGKLPLPGPGRFELEVPAGYGELQLQAFQDERRDGPSDDDPFGWVTVEVGEEDVEELVIVLERGGKLLHAAETGPEEATAPFFDHEGETVAISGEVRGDDELPVNLDVRVPDPGAPGGNRQIGKLMLPPGEGFSFEAPVAVGPLILEAFQDLSGDGPDGGDPWGSLEVDVGERDRSGLLIELAVGAKGAAAAGAPAGSGGLFADHEGDWVHLRVLVVGEQQRPVDLDLRAPDATAPGGNVQVGKEVLAGPGATSLRVPEGFGAIWLEAFQDLESDGPSAIDPYAKAALEIGDEDTSVTLQLVVGGFSADGQPDRPNPEHTPDEGGAPTVPRGGGAEVFGPIEGPSVTVMGSISVSGEQDVLIDLDLFTRDPDSPGGRRYLGKLKLEPGPWRLEVPADFGVLEVEALVDRDGDGPTPGDAFAAYGGNPIRIGRENVYGVDIRL